MPEYLAPGVYVEETSFRAPSIQSVATSTTAFVGPCRKGPVGGTPELMTSFAEFERVHGGLDDLDQASAPGVPATNYLAYAARAFFDEGGRRLYVARTWAPRDEADPDDGMAEGAILPGRASLVARFPGSALNGRAILRRRELPAGAAVLGRAPVGSLVRAGGDSVAGGAVLTGGTAPFALADGAELTLALPGGDRSIRLEGRPAEAAGVAVADPAAVATGGAVLAVTIGGVRQEITLPAGPVAIDDLANHINPRLRGGWAEVRGGNQLVIGTDQRGSGARVQVGQLDAIGFPASAAVLRSGTGNVASLDRVAVAEIDALLQGASPPVPVRATAAADGRLRLVTSATGEAATLTVSGSARAALGLPAEEASGTEGGARFYLKVVGGFQKADPADPDFNPATDAATLLLVDVELQDASGERLAALEGLGFHPDHPAAIHRALPATPARPADALAYPYRFAATGGALSAFELHQAMFPAGGESSIIIVGGHDGAEPGPAQYAEALQRLGEIDDIAIVAAPGHSVLSAATYRTVQGALAGHAQDSGFRIAVLDPEPDLDLAGIRNARGRIDSSYAALYWPWVVVANPRARPGREDIPAELALPPSGHVCGIYARNDVLRGVHKAPANEVVRQALRFEREVPTGVQEVLNPIGVNCLRFLTGRGFRVWGARLATSEREVVYVSDRRYLNYLKRSIYVSMQWAVFEPNGPQLWSNITDAVEGFLFTEWRNGALLGTTPEQAFFVRCDRSTMTEADLANGRLVCEVGVALIKPAEFVIFRIGQKTADARG